MHDKTEQARELRLVRGITFALGTLRIRFEPTVVEFLEKHRQRNWFANERAGQLFATIDGNVVAVSEATGPRRGDRADHISYDIDRKAAQREIDDRYEKGLHYIGDWHTHPQKTPGPSTTDILSMARLFCTSSHQLNIVAMLIVGTGGPEAWWCSAHDGDGMTALVVESEADMKPKDSENVLASSHVLRAPPRRRRVRSPDVSHGFSHGTRLC
jgi:integrative and conjugative element protein (TIGR02256 family)